MIVLGIETSCDETAAAVVDGDRRIWANSLFSQAADHARHGGVVPEVAARAHLEVLDGQIRAAMEQAGIAWDSLDAIAATCGPGLIGGVLVGATTGKALSLALGKPFVAVNHLEAHVLTARLSNDVPFPYLCLLVSGGHCQLIEVEGIGLYRCLGTTLDDASGEAFDKAARLLGLGYPGGPAIEKAAIGGDPTRFALPCPMLGRPGCDFSFSGLKTALRLVVEKLPYPLSEADRKDAAAAFQNCVARALADRTAHAAEIFSQRHGPGGTLVVAGGVAANGAIRAALQQIAEKAGLNFVAPPVALCTDNAAMIAWVGVERRRLGLSDSLDIQPRPRWPLSELKGAA